jgi:hypothetical protein
VTSTRTAGSRESGLSNRKSDILNRQSAIRPRGAKTSTSTSGAGR